MRPFLLSAAAVVLVAAAGRADDTPVTKVFEVADLVTPVPDFALPKAGGAASPAERFRQPTSSERADQFVRQVIAVVRPASWAANGGAGVAEYHDLGNTLVVKNTPAVVAEVGAYLTGLRRLQDVSVVTEVRLVSVPAGFAAGAGVKAGGVLTEADVARFLNTAQGDARCNVMQCPKLTTFDGQVATIRLGEQLFLVTGIETTTVKGQVVYVPQKKPADLGHAITLCGRLSADATAVSLRVHAAHTRLLDEKVELVPMTTMITPVFEGGSQGKPVPFTQFVQAPKLKTDAAERAARVPDGQTLVVGGWTEPGGRFEAGVPVLSQIPYVSRLFKTTGIGPDREVVVLATVRVIRAAEEATPEK